MSDGGGDAWFFAWTPDDYPARVISVPDGWDEIRERYSPRRKNAPLERLIEIATEHEVESVLIEGRYIDADFRSEHSSFYSTTFRRYPSVCHRLHFFRGSLSDDPSQLGEVKKDRYIGYAVMRPIPNAPVGRTVILPPPELNGGAVTIANDTVHLWGHEFTATGMPFISQDAQYLRCAHSALWMMLYHAHLVHGAPRRLPSEIQLAAQGGNVLGRQVPSEGLSTAQVLKALHEMRLSGPRIKLPDSRDKSKNDHRLSLIGIASRYVNSQMPPMVYSDSHAWVVVGYKREAGDGDRHDAIVLYRHDDARGPYLRIDDPWIEPVSDHYPWKGAIPPLPSKLYMTSERAELVGETRLVRHLHRLADDHPVRIKYPNDNGLTVRTHATTSVAFVAGLWERFPAEVASFLSFHHWSKWLWVVELVDKDRLDAGQPCVVGEAVIDGTASNLSQSTDPVLMARRIWNEPFVYSPDHGKLRKLPLTPDRIDYVESACDAVRGWEYPHR